MWIWAEKIVVNSSSTHDQRKRNLSLTSLNLLTLAGEKDSESAFFFSKRTLALYLHE